MPFQRTYAEEIEKLSKQTVGIKIFYENMVWILYPFFKNVCG